MKNRIQNFKLKVCRLANHFGFCLVTVCFKFTFGTKQMNFEGIEIAKKMTCKELNKKRKSNAGI